MDYEFTTDGCSVVPERDHKECCVHHDWLYYQGGSWLDRWRADAAFYRCMKETKTGWLAPVRWAGVRMGGTPLLHLSWRWGYGWRYPRASAPDPDSSPFSAESQRPAYEAAVAEAREHDDRVRTG